MKMDNLAAISPEKLQQLLPGILSRNITEPRAAAACEQALSELIGKWTAGVSQRVLADLLRAGTEIEYYAANDASRAVSRRWAHHVLAEHSIDGFEHLEEALERGPVVLLSNHASYIDSPLLDALLAHESEAIANRVVHVAGPKVYQAFFRRMAAICLNTIPVQQSASVAKIGPDGEAVPQLSPRELAHTVQLTISASEAALARGRILLLYPEGSRTRSGRLGAFLPGTYRYLRLAKTQVVPLALEGTGAMMSVANDLVTPRTCRLRIGQAIDVHESGGPRKALEVAHAAISSLLPEYMRPHPSS